MGTVLAAGCGGGDAPSGAAASGGTAGAGGTAGSGGTDLDAGVDAGPGCDEVPALAGELGGQCRGASFDCNGDLECLPQQDIALGGADDPILAHPDGENTAETFVEFEGDYCTLLMLSVPGGCSTEQAEACAAECGVCDPYYSNASLCLRGCRAEAGTNSTCREGYECDLFVEACYPGCSTDADCLVFREDTNENGMFDPYDPMTGMGDRLRWDDSSYFCNVDTHRCEHPGTIGAEAGDPCTGNEQCESNGTCLDEETFEYPGGYCSKVRCDIDTCAGDAVCAGLGFGIPLCVASCQVGAGAEPGNPSTYLGNTQGCREAYTCIWGGVAGDSGGGCVPGEFNDQTTNNIGSDCTESSECYSPFGQGACGTPALTCSLIDEPAENCSVGFGCTVFDCGADGMPDDVCGQDAECIADGSSGLSFCVAKCSSAENCLDGAACADLDGDPLTLDTVCLPFCVDDNECRAGEACNALGECTGGS